MNGSASQIPAIRVPVFLAAALAATLALGGCDVGAAPAATPTSTTAAPAAAPKPAATPAAPAAPAAPKAAKSRHSTSGEEQYKYGCEQGQLPKADCDKFFAGAKRDGIIFNP